MSAGDLERAEAAVQAFAERLGLGEELSLDAGGVGALRLGEGPRAVALTLEAVPEDGRLLVHAVVSTLRARLSLPLAERLLGLALHGVATGGGALGYDPARGEVLLTLGERLSEVDAGRVGALVDEAYARALALREALAGEGGPAGSAERPDATSSGSGEEAGGAGFSGLSPREQSGPHRLVIPG